MHLKTVSLRNFRCFTHIDLELHPRLTVLVSENGGGKTSILDGLALGLAPLVRFLSTADKRLKTSNFADTDFSLVPYRYANEDKWGRSDYTQVILTTTDGMCWDNWKPTSAGKKPDAHIGQSELYSYTQNLLAGLKREPPPLLPIFAYYGAQRGHIQIPQRLWEAEDDSEQRTSALVGALSAYNNFKDLLKWFDTEQSAELFTNKGNPEQDYLELPSLRAVRNAIVSLLGGQFENPHFNARHKFVVNPKNSIGELQITQLSQGYQSMLAMGMDIARRLSVANSHLDYVDNTFDWSFATDYLRKNHPNGLPNAPARGSCWSPAIVLIDEIDLHLHPAWQQRVLADLMGAFPCAQFVVTSHSPQVLSTVPMESIRIIRGGQVYSAPPGTDGAEAQRVLETVFQVQGRPDTEMARVLDDYLRLVDQRQWETPKALELRAKLDNWSQGQEPRLLEADLQIENLKWEMGK